MVDTCFYAPEVFQRLVVLIFVGKLCCLVFKVQYVLQK